MEHFESSADSDNGFQRTFALLFGEVLGQVARPGPVAKLRPEALAAL